MRAIVSQHSWSAENDFADIKTEIGKRHGEAAKRLQDWIHLPSIAAENRGYPEGVDYMIKLRTRCGVPASDARRYGRETGRICDA